jgi:hypothetical protein
MLSNQEPLLVVVMCRSRTCFASLLVPKKSGCLLLALRIPYYRRHWWPDECALNLSMGVSSRVQAAHHQFVKPKIKPGWLIEKIEEFGNNK